MTKVVPVSPVVTLESVREEISAPVPQEVKVVGKKDVASDEKPETTTVQEAMQKQLDDFSQQAESSMQKVRQRVETSRYLILIDNEVSTYDQLDKVAPENIYLSLIHI